MKISLLLVLASLISFGSMAAYAQKSSTAKEDSIRQVMVLTGQANLAKQMMAQVLGPLQQALPQVPEKVWRDFVAEMKAEELVELIVPVYDRNFTQEEIDAMLVFYRSEVGQSIMKKMSVVMQESITVGQEWGKAIADRVLSKLKAKGYKIEM